MTEAEKKDLAEKFVAGLTHHDQKLLNSILTEDVVWSLPGQSLMSGEAHGVPAILKRAETLGAYGVRIEIEHLVYGYQDVALHLAQHRETRTARSRRVPDDGLPATRKQNIPPRDVHFGRTDAQRFFPSGKYGRWAPLEEARKE
jgi:hypothetical protein